MKLAGADTRGGGLGGQDSPSPFLGGPTNFIKWEQNIALVRSNATRFSS